VRVLLTRPLDDSRAVVEALRPDGIACLIWPLTRIVPTADLVEIPDATGGLLFTSANGVRAFAALSARRDLAALCVGEATAEAARRAGFADVRSAAAKSAGKSGGDARALAELARGSGIGVFLHPRGRHAAGDLAGWLRASGQRVREAVLYEAAEGGPPPPAVAEALAAGGLDLVTAWSPRGAGILAARLAGLEARLDRTDLLAISAAAAEPLGHAGFRRHLVAEAPSGAAMLSAIRAAARMPQ
jgi:uroporphyrinogen-III synthase